MAKSKGLYSPSLPVTITFDESEKSDICRRLILAQILVEESLSLPYTVKLFDVEQCLSSNRVRIVLACR